MRKRIGSTRKLARATQSPWWGPLSRAIDALVNLFKWPVAIIAALALPLSAIAAGKLLARIWAEPTPVLPFTVGLVAYFLAWHFILRHRIFGSFFSTLEHELTHALFALASFHPVRELRSTFSRGGHMQYQSYGSNGNWLITISPYFFPSASLVVLILLALVPGDLRWWAESLLGVSTAYHITSTMRETHAGQTDLQKVGYFFSLLFLPAANIIALGVVVAFAHAGLAGVGRFLLDNWPQFLIIN